MAPRRTLITGGSSSGKSRYAEGLLAGEAQVTYIAPGYIPDPVRDPEWAARVAAHRLRRPAHWRTRETANVAAALAEAEGPLLLDCLGTWDMPLEQWRDRFQANLDELVHAWRDVGGPAVAVTNEVGWGVVPEHRSGRVFTDLLGRVNVAMAAASDEVLLVVAGRALHL